MGNEVVVMENEIVSCGYKVWVKEEGVMQCGLKEIGKSEGIEGKRGFYISGEEFIEVGGKGDKVGREIREGRKEVMKKRVQVKRNRGILEFDWVCEVLGYDKKGEEKVREKQGEGKEEKEYMKCVRVYKVVDGLGMRRRDDVVGRVVFDERVVGVLSDLKGRLSEFLVNDVGDFSSMYRYGIYEVMMGYK